MEDSILLPNEAPRSKLRGITEFNFEDFSEAEANPVASYGESQVELGFFITAKLPITLDNGPV